MSYSRTRDKWNSSNIYLNPSNILITVSTARCKLLSKRLQKFNQKKIKNKAWSNSKSPKPVNSSTCFALHHKFKSEEDDCHEEGGDRFLLPPRSAERPPPLRAPAPRPSAPPLRPCDRQVTGLHLDVDATAAATWRAPPRQVLRHGARSSSRALVKKKEERARGNMWALRGL